MKNSIRNQTIASYQVIFIILSILLVVGLLILFVSRKNKEVVKYGRIQTFLNIYYNASTGVDDSYQIHLSDMSFRNDLIVEFIPENNNSISKPFNVIKDGMFFSADSLGGLKIEKDKMKTLAEKKTGAIFTSDSIYKYFERVNMKDTILYNQYLKRFYIATENDYSVFYVDTAYKNLPYSFNKQVDNDYKGALVRIDTYQPKLDKFTTLLLQYNDTVPNKMYETLNKLQSKSK